MSDSTDLFKEVEEDLERQRLQALWDRYGQWVLILAILIVSATGGYTYYNNWQVKKSQATTLELLHLLQAANDDKSKNPATTEHLNDFYKTHPNAAGAIASLYAAYQFERNGDLDKALAGYESLAADAKQDMAITQFALLNALRLRMDRDPPAEVEKKLSALTGEGQPWAYTAREYQAYLALKQGDKPRAKAMFTGLAQDPNIPAQMLGRINDILPTLED